MNTQMDRLKGHKTTAYGEDTHDHNVPLQHSGEGHDEGEQHHEKKSVLKKVKAKAKKIKDTITGHVGHGHNDHDEDDDDEIDSDPDVHGAPAAHGVSTGKEGIPGQHGLNIGGRTAIGGDHVAVSKPDAYQVFDPTTTHYVPGQEETLGWSRTDTGTKLGSETRRPPVIGHSIGTQSAGNLEVHHKPKYGGILEKDHGPKDVESGVHPANYQAKVAGLTGAAAHGVSTGKEGIPRQHGTSVGERTAIGGDHVAVSKPDPYQVFDPSTTHYVPGQEETLGWSRTDAGTNLGSGNQPHALRHTPVIAHSTGNQSTGDLDVHHKPKFGGILEKDHGPKNVGGDVHPANYQAKAAGPTGAGYGAAEAQDYGFGQGGGTERQHGGILGQKSAMEGASRIPVSKPVEYQTFDTPTSRYVPGQDETLGWSRTDTGRSKLSEEGPYAPKNTPITAHSGGHYDTGLPQTGQMRDSGQLGGIIDRPTTLEKDPHAPRDFGERRQAENYQSKVTDPTGRGDEEMGVPPIVHQLGKMNIHDGMSQKADADVNMGQQEDLFRPSLGQHEMSTGSHDQFSPEPVTRETSTFLQPPESRSQYDAQGLQDREEQKPGSYTEKISSVASELAHKAKIATSSVTSKLGYGGSSETTSAAPHDQQTVQGPLDNKPVPGGYGETLSSVSTAVTDTAAHAKDAVASKLGYGGETREGHFEHGQLGYGGETREGPLGHGQQSKAGSVGDYGKKVVSSVQEKIAPVYDKVAGLGAAVASKVQGSGPEHTTQPSAPISASAQRAGPESDVVPTPAPDKGVSVKEYLVEKLKPGEEDKALSKVITDALPLHKQKESPTDIGQQGDEKMKVEIKSRVTESDQEKKVVIKGRVTESEEVANRLGRAEDTSYDDAGPGLASPGKTVMDRIMDAAGSWFNKSGEPHLESGDPTLEGNERTQSTTVLQQNQSVGEPRPQ